MGSMHASEQLSMGDKQAHALAEQVSLVGQARLG
jgi:hypothetical protein